MKDRKLADAKIFIFIVIWFVVIAIIAFLAV